MPVLDVRPIESEQELLKNGRTNSKGGLFKRSLRACLHGGGGPQIGEVTRLGGVTRLSI